MSERTALAGFLRERGLRDEAVLEAMSRVPREQFVPVELRARAYADEALPIGHDATISQPFMVALICSLLELGGGERVLDVGTGSGYQAAVLAELGADVVTIELVPALATSARAALEAAGYGQVEVRIGDGGLGAPDRAPFDGIAIAAAAPSIPAALLAQLATGGRLVAPVGGRRGQRLRVAVRGEAGLRATDSVECRFVPLLGSAGFGNGEPWDSSAG